MKGRSQRSEPAPDEWGDGSWTVDCSCGVTFDDGEEMVSCDECGVWVHTRCARFVKGEPSFACHNCKAAATSAAAADGDGDAEETEVAQLLAELPTKTGPASLPPFRRWAKVPLRDRVHVQGVPGGDPALFSGRAPSVFTADLWRCTGFVPKKFGFQYREFPCWEKQEVGEEDGQINAGRVANALFAISKEPQSTISGMRAWSDRPVSSGKKESDGRKDELVEGDRSGKKKASGEVRRRAGSVSMVDKNTSDVSKDRDLQVVDSVPPNLENDGTKREISTESNSAGWEVGAACHVPDPNTVQKISGEILMKVEKIEAMESVKTELPPRSDAFSIDAGRGRCTESKKLLGIEPPKDGHHRLLSQNGGSGSSTMKTEGLEPASSDPRGGQDLIDILMPPNSDKIAVQMAGGGKFSSGEANVRSSSLSYEKLVRPDPHPHHYTSGQLYENQQDHGSISGLLSSESKDIETLSSYQGCDKITDRVSFKIDEPRNQGQGAEDGHGSVSGNESLNFETPNLANSIQDGPKSILAIPKTSASSPGPAVSCSPFSRSPELLGPETSVAGKTVRLPKQLQGKGTLIADGKNISSKSSGFVQENFREYSRKHVKCQVKGPIPSGQKSTQESKVSYSSLSKHRLPDSKEQTSKAVSTVGAAPIIHSGEVTSSYSRSKHISSNSSQKGVKIEQQASQSSLDVTNNSMPINLQVSEATSTNTLSDEQLALLLHQQLNSSPRVPRVPRVRQTSGMQIAPPIATSVFSKRAPPFGGRDQISVSKKKNKEDLARESSHNACHITDETRRFTIENSARRDSQSRLIGHVTLTRQSPGTLSNEAASSIPSVEASGSNISLIHGLTRDDPSDNICLNPRTLPGLIEDTLNKNRHMTYEQLCDAVRPYWNDLRKPNGEKYAYPTHLHAVHDCLRNRTEWAHLIDQVPKTNSSKKRRKHDADATPSIGFDKDKAKNKDQKQAAEEKSAESIGEDFPKGKQKARKRRRLELQGRRVKDARKSHSHGSVSDDDPADSLARSSMEAHDAVFSDGESEERPPALGASSTSSSSSDAH